MDAPASRAAAIASSTVASLRVSFPSVTTMITRPSRGSAASAFAERTSASKRVVPRTESIAMWRRAVSASIVAVEKSVRSCGFVAKVATAIRSLEGLAPMNARAAAIASASGCPFID
jgi:hypothetical protein